MEKKKNKFSIDDRERAVLKVLKERRSCRSVARDLQTCNKLLGRWVNTYKLHGKKGFSLKNKIHFE